MPKKTKLQFPTIISVAVSAFLLIIALFWFGSVISEHSDEILSERLSERQTALSAVIKARAGVLTEVIEHTASSAEKKDPAGQLSGTGLFAAAGTVTSDGKMTGAHGEPFDAPLPYGFAELASKGTCALAGTIEKNGTKEVIFFGTPLPDGSGFLFAAAKKSDITAILDLTALSDGHTSILFDGSGKVIAMSSNASGAVKNSHFVTEKLPDSSYDYDEDHAELDDTEPDFIYTVSYTGVNDWFLAVAVPRSESGLLTSELRTDLTILVILTAFAFILLLVAVMYLMKSNEDIRRSNERFKLVTVEAQDLVFDYDFNSRSLTLDGNIDELTGDSSRNVFSSSEALGFIGRINEEEKEIRQRIASIRSSTDNSIKSEFRLKCADGSYSWFRMKGTVVRDKDGAAQRFIGSLINADEQMGRDMRITEKSETDPLTGIFNKTAFYEHVNEQLRGASDSDLFAVYIIDIDGFNRVNDELGHQMGDSVLADAAKKLCIVFSEKDCVGHIGGDEFGAFLHLSAKARSAGMSIIEDKAKAICAQMRDTYASKNKQVSVTASVGAAIYPYSGRDYNTLYRKADKALYKVKEGGKNNYCIYSPEDEQ